MKTLYGDLPLTEGEGHIVDYNLKTLKEKEIPFLRRKLGVVFQDFKLLSDRTINDNLLFVLKATGWTDKKEMATRLKVLNFHTSFLEENNSALLLQELYLITQNLF